MRIETGAAVDLFGAMIQLRDGGVAEVGGSGRDRAGLWTVTAFHADDDRSVHSDVWERHPAGDEVLCVLSGTLNVHLRDQRDAEGPAATLTPGQSFVVPVGRWHRLTVEEPGDLLVISPRVDTQHERVRMHEGGTDGE